MSSSIEMNQFLKDLKTFKEWHKESGFILTIDQMIEMVEEEVKEMKLDHLLEDVREDY